MIRRVAAPMKRDEIRAACQIHLGPKVSAKEPSATVTLDKEVSPALLIIH